MLPVLFGRVLIPQAVWRELQHPHTPTAVRAWIAVRPAWLALQAIAGQPETALEGLEAGEQEAIVLARETQARLVLLDDGKARDVAMAQGLRVMGTVGVLAQAARRGSVDLPEVFARLATTNSRIRRTLLEEILARDTERRRPSRPDENPT
ncbi:MAG: DUF3368 domain-containing protein [Candidatus Tectomicrobia bacterium]|uniref:DUF3368 domain-containing protein n=1 Tax=Tectimicrobiota bacterium TaxID=2528274 RepID=A0A937W585_UNCTE|nr:DUF3368 domain-containing protein [Candidatus Tectomicrobia bacterium]